MRAMVLPAAGEPLELRELAVPEPGPGELQIAVEACGVCRTDLHIVDGELTEPKLPLVPGHQIAGTGLRPTARPYPLAEANRALADLRDGRIDGAAVLVVG